MLMKFIGLVLVLPTVLASTTLQKRDHVITLRNNCGNRNVTPVFHAGGSTTTTAAQLGPGQATTLTVPEAKAAWRIFGQTGQCSMPDGAGCTLLECSFDNPQFRQCNLSRVDGFNLGITFSFSDGSCSGNNCLTNTCDGNHAFSNPTNGGPSIRQCNTPNVGMTVTFSC